MLVILRENIENLGRTGDVIKVSEGYARNFLLPRKLVVAAQEGNLKSIEHHKRVLEKKRATEKLSAEEMAKKIGDFSCTIARKVGANDKLFGSVSTGDIAEALIQAGFAVKKKDIVLLEPIKTLGVHPVKVTLLTDVTATVKVWVVKEEG